MQEFQQRVIQEQKELEDKIRKLYFFMKSDKFIQLASTNSAEADRMRKQHAVMIEYNDILKERIMYFN